MTVFLDRARFIGQPQLQITRNVLKIGAQGQNRTADTGIFSLLRIAAYRVELSVFLCLFLSKKTGWLIELSGCFITHACTDFGRYDAR